MLVQSLILLLLSMVSGQMFINTKDYIWLIFQIIIFSLALYKLIGGLIERR